MLAVYRGEDTIGKTVSSILAQVGIQMEVIIVDDGNLPVMCQLLRNIEKEDSRVTVLRSESNEGLTKALIRGCNVARGEYIARIDNGDIMVPENRLQLQLEMLDKHEEIVLVGGMLRIVDLLNGDVYESKWKPSKMNYAHVTVMFRRRAYVECGGYSEAAYCGQDSELWPRLLRRGAGITMPVIFAVAFMKSDSISVANNNRQIIGKIRRLYQAVVRGEKEWYVLMSVAVEVIKMLIPIKTRVKWRYRRNFNFVGTVSDIKEFQKHMER